MKLTLHDTLAFIHRMHAGMEDWAGLPYTMHPIAVMLSLPPQCTVEDQHLVLMHDVVEDCKQRLIEEFDLDVPHFIPDEWKEKEAMRLLDRIFFKLEDRGYTDYIIRGLKLLTRDYWPKLTYIEYVQNIADSDHMGAIWGKYCDNLENRSLKRQARLSPELQEKSRQMAKRYDRSIAILEKRLGIK